MHSGDIATVLEFLRRRLAEEGIPFAVIGALALRYYGYVRHTEEIDILTTREGLDRIHATLVGHGLAPRGPGPRTRLSETAHQVNIDVVTSAEDAGSSESPVEYPPPDSNAFVEIAGLRLPTIEALVEFKNRQRRLGPPRTGSGRRATAHPHQRPPRGVQRPHRRDAQ